MYISMGYITDQGTSIQFDCSIYYFSTNRCSEIVTFKSNPSIPPCLISIISSYLQNIHLLNSCTDCLILFLVAYSLISSSDKVSSSSEFRGGRIYRKCNCLYFYAFLLPDATCLFITLRLRSLTSYNFNCCKFCCPFFNRQEEIEAYNSSPHHSTWFY